MDSAATRQDMAVVCFGIFLALAGILHYVLGHRSRTLALTPESAEAMFLAAGSEEDEYIKVELAEGLLELGDVRGVSLLLDIMDLGTKLQARQDAFEHLQAHVRSSLPYDPDPQFANHAQEMQAFREWWAGRRAEGLDSPR